MNWYVWIVVYTLIRMRRNINMNRLTVVNALQSLKDEKEPFKELFSHGSLSVEIYKPDSVDLQQPHNRDELYVIASGSGFFVNGKSRERCEKGEVLFVPAGIVHRLEEFTEDFSTWVFFYGPVGGEAIAE
ncbi:MAG: mannose-6-phosphate isomerase-like protein (cupin superfamily) [Candidatus Endobugula sp.]|jgi:mannose-6-phosphate isomerase-like protein (cupin superfamily)